MRVLGVIGGTSHTVRGPGVGTLLMPGAGVHNPLVIEEWPGPLRVLR